jgi:hypothetical protein
MDMTPRAKTGLVALDFTSDIKRLTRDFTGRKWLLDEVDAWLKRQGEHFFILTGGPSMGKSVIPYYDAASKHGLDFAMAV